MSLRRNELREAPTEHQLTLRALTTHTHIRRPKSDCESEIRDGNCPALVQRTGCARLVLVAEGDDPARVSPLTVRARLD